MRKSRLRSLYSRMANRSEGSTFCTISATLASNWSRSRVSVMAAETSSRKSSSSLRSWKRTAALRVLCMALCMVRRSGSGGLDNLHDGAGLMSYPHHGLNIVLHGIGIARTQRAHVDHHVDFLRSGAQRGRGFADLGVRAGGAEREPHHGADLHARARQF